MLNIRIKYLRDILPIEQFDDGDWIDLRCAESTMLKKGDYKAIPLGVAMEIPEGYTAIIAPRSSAFGKYGVLCANSFGIIDNSYNGDTDEWHFLVYATKTTLIWKNDRICQFRLIKTGDAVKFEEVKFLGNEDRGGFGSTGRV